MDDRPVMTIMLSVLILVVAMTSLPSAFCAPPQNGHPIEAEAAGTFGVPLPAPGSFHPAPNSLPDGYPVVAEVTRTFDGKPFTYRIESGVEKNGYRMYRITYPSPIVTAVPQNNTVPAEYYVPSAMGPKDPKRPAVICMHILDGNMELVRMTATVLASHGVPAILFKLPYYGERGLPEGPQAMARNPRMFLSAISQAMQDVRRTVDLLSAQAGNRPGLSRHYGDQPGRNRGCDRGGI